MAAVPRVYAIRRNTSNHDEVREIPAQMILECSEDVRRPGLVIRTSVRKLGPDYANWRYRCNLGSCLIAAPLQIQRSLRWYQGEGRVCLGGRPGEESLQHVLY